MTPEQYERGFLFHGTLERFTGQLEPGADGLLWLAESSAVAQAYIPSTGLTIYLSMPRPWMLDESPRPATQDDPWGRAWRRLAGAEYSEVEYDAIGRPRRWRIDRSATWRDLVRALEGLGYDTSSSSVAVRATLLRGAEELLPADYRAEGRLFIVRTTSPLRLADLTGEEGDLGDPQYNWFEVFRRLEAAGYDGVRINDFLQSDKWGNVGHISIGVFPRGLPKLTYTSVPARNYDPEDLDGWRRPTPEFLEFWREGCK